MCAAAKRIGQGGTASSCNILILSASWVFKNIRNDIEIRQVYVHRSLNGDLVYSVKDFPKMFMENEPTKKKTIFNLGETVVNTKCRSVY